MNISRVSPQKAPGENLKGVQRSTEDKHTFDLKIDGVSVFQWFKDMARKLLEKMGFRQPQPKQGKGLHH